MGFHNFVLNYNKFGAVGADMIYSFIYSSGFSEQSLTGVSPDTMFKGVPKCPICARMKEEGSHSHCQPTVISAPRAAGALAAPY